MVEIFMAEKSGFEKLIVEMSGVEISLWEDPVYIL